MSRARRKLSSIGLILKEDSRSAGLLAGKMRSWLEARGVSVWVARHRKNALDCKSVPAVDLLLVLGGDGTIVATARQVLGKKIPLAGVNFGRVGFLAEVARENWRQSLERALAEGFAVEERLTLRYSLTRGKEVLFSGQAVNDLVISRGIVARLGKLEFSVDGKPFAGLRSDGVIFSTPTGSTGYAGSAGGPLVQPQLNLFLIVPICPFLNSLPPLAMAADSVFSATVSDGGTDLFLTVDGQQVYALQTGDCLEVTGVPGGLLSARMGGAGYFDRLVAAGFIHAGKRP